MVGALLLGGVVLVPAADLVHAASFTVTTEVDGADSAPGDGLCETAGGQCALRAAVMESNALPGDDAIVFAPDLGSLVLTLATPDSQEDTGATGDLDVIGAGDLTITGNGVDATVVSADGLGDRVFDASGDGDLTIERLTIRGGTAPGTAGGGGVAFGGNGSFTLSEARVLDNMAYVGGGVWVSGEATTTTMSEVAFTRNHAANDGGGAFLGGPGSITGVDLIENVADRNGGGLNIAIVGSATVALDDVDVNVNTAGLDGGGIWLGQVSPTATFTARLTDSMLTGNEATVDGGGLSVLAATVIVERSSVVANRAGTPVSGGGGGVATVGAELIVRDSTVADNVATSAGGLGVSNSTTTIERSTISGNAPSGLVACCFDSTASLVNSTVSGNADAGIDATTDGPVTLDHVTVVGNTAVVWSPFAEGATFSVHGSIVAGVCNGTLQSGGNNVVSDVTCQGVGDQLGDPRLGPLAPNGGTTMTHHPLDGSPAIDAVAPPCPGTDQRSVPRPADVRCDAGAVEVVPAVPEADLALTLDGSAEPVVIGQPVRWTATVANHGPDAANGLTLTFRIPAEVTFTSADPGCTHLAGEVTCTIDVLAAGASSARTVVAAAPADAGTVTATANVTASSPTDPDQANNSALVMTAVVVPSVTVDDASVIEGTSAESTPVGVTATLSAPAGVPVSVQFSTVDGTAVTPDDYGTASGALLFPSGATTATADLAVVADTVVEPDEAFGVRLSDPERLTIADGSAVVSIDDDDVPALSINDVTVLEPDAGTTDAVFEITLDQPPLAPVTAAVAAVAGSVVAGSDFVATSGTVTFGAGEQSEPFVVPIVGDLTPEPTEEYTVTLSNPAGATLADGDGTGTITDTDVVVQGFTIDDVSVTEPDAGVTRATFTVRRGSSNGVASVLATTIDGTATQPDDYRARSIVVRFPAGVTQRLFDVVVAGDLLAEPDETFLVRLSAPVGAPIDDAEGVGTIIDNGDICTQVGSAAADVMTGGSGDDVLCGFGGDDELYGQDGDDQLIAGPGNDAVYGGEGDDRLAGEFGNDELDGSSGADDLSGGIGNDALQGGSGADQLIGGTGADVIDGGDGDDELHGDEGGDPEDPVGGFDWLTGGPGDDTLHGQAGNDLTLDGGPGIDRIHGGTGNDAVSGGPEAGNVLVGGSGDTDRCTIGPPAGNTRDTSCERPQPGTIAVDPWWTA